MSLRGGSVDVAASAADLVPDTAQERPPVGSLWSRLSLKPYGDALCTPGAAFWIFCARVAIFVMASAEALSWSYLGYYIGQSSQPYVSATLAGLAIFSVIWIVDASFITLDTSRTADESAILGKTVSGHSDKWRLAAGLLIRGAIISATLVISAPFLAQLVFFRDISAEMNRRDATLAADQRARVAASFDARAAALLNARQSLDEASIREAAGAGPSGRMGRGPAVATIEKRLADVDGQLAALGKEKEDALRGFDTLSRTELQQRYGLQFAEDGIRTRGEILSALRTNETYANAELAIRGFLAFLFLALIVLKLFQPASVAVYYSEILQDLNAQYRAGSFDSWLPPEERSYARVGLTPLRFKAWAVDNYRTVREEGEQQRRVDRTLAIRTARETELRTLRVRAEQETNPAREAVRAATDALAELQNDMQRVAGELEASREQLASQESAIETLRTTMRSGIDGPTLVRAAEAQTALDREAAATRAAIRAQEAELQRLRHQAERQLAAFNDARARLASREAVVQTIDGQLTQLTESSSALLLS